jgi:aldose sugar dehydrogenase
MVRFSPLVAVMSTFAAPLAAEQTRAPTVPKSDVAVEVVAQGLNHPWGLQVLPDGRMLVTERPGRLRVVDKDGKLSPPVQGVPGVAASGQGGLLDVVLSPKFTDDRTIFLSFAEPRPNSRAGTSVARGILTMDGAGARLDDVKVIFRQEPAVASGHHFGSRLVFGRDGNLFVTTGDRGAQDLVQKLDTHVGKVLRIRPDGSVPPDNPYAGRADAKPEIWSAGHRNAQGAALNPATGELWTIEHGARGGDEINIPRKGRNYGWPVITYGRDYSGAKIGIGTDKDGMEQPQYYWDPSIAPSGAAFYTSTAIPAWTGSLFAGALAGQHLARLVLKGDTVVGEERLLSDRRERIRDVRAGPDGAIYVLTDDTDGKILRVTAKR